MKTFESWYKQTKELSISNKNYFIGKVTSNYRTFKRYFEQGLTPLQALNTHFL